MMIERGDLVRSINNAHGLVVESDASTNTARVHYVGAKEPQAVSWWDLKRGNDETTAAVGTLAQGYVSPTLKQQDPLLARKLVALSAMYGVAR